MSTDEWGIDDGWRDTLGHEQRASPATVEAIRGAMGDPGAGRPLRVVRPGVPATLTTPSHLLLEDGSDLGEVAEVPPDLPLGVHLLTPADGSRASWLLVSPGRCHLPAGLRAWGVVAQVPTTRSRRSWGIGDLADVRSLARLLAARGAGFLALSPLHAPTPVPPIATSAYYPSSRRWRSPLLIRVDEVPGAGTPEIAALAQAARALLGQPLLDRDACWSLQRAALERLWAAAPPAERHRLDAWRAEQGPALEGWARFCALAERHGPSWRSWPAELRHPEGPRVATAARELDDRIALHGWLQLLVDDQLDAVRAEGVRVVQDLAIGVDPGGADAWLWQDLLAGGFSVGAPPDDFAPAGQRWGLPPWVPWRVRDVGYRPVAELLRAALVAGGGLRIDHVMGLTRLFWIPAGGEPADGAYVRFPGRELLELVAMESARSGAIVVGEDLGTVEPGFRIELADTGILSTRVAWFEHDPPEAWPEQALALVTTHDLPTLAGVCLGTDAPGELRARLEGLVGPVAGRSPAEVSPELHRRLGRSGAMLAAATLEDLLGVVERPNRPGTLDDERPNWSRPLPVPIEDLEAEAPAVAALDALAGGRAEGARPAPG